MDIWSKLREWVPLIVLSFIVGAGVVYGSVHDPNAGAKKVREASIKSCQRNVARAQIFKEFTEQAAEARRQSAAAEEANGEKILAQNDLATANAYESMGKRWVELTPTNCEELFPEL